jgi:AbrB family looped-hinge helix DNA binding protein
MATSVKMSSKHQIVIPREAREALGLEPGDRLVVSVRDDGVIEMEPEPRDLVGELAGILSGAIGRSGAPDRPGDHPGAAHARGRGEAGLWPELEDA